MTNFIRFNPVRHRHVTRVKDWAFSSFHRMVRLGVYPEDWGGDMRDVGSGDGFRFGER